MESREWKELPFQDFNNQPCLWYARFERDNAPAKSLGSALYGNDDISLLVSLIDIRVRLNHLLQWIASVYYRL